MLNLNINEWILINEIIYKINTTSDILHVQKSFLNLLKHLIPYDSALFYLKAPDKDCFMSNPVCIEYDLDTANNYILFGMEKDYTTGIMQCSKCIICKETDLMPDEERIQTDYYKLFLRQKELHFGIQVTLVHNGVLLGIVSLLRKIESRDFGERDILVLDMLKEHLAYRLSIELLKVNRPMTKFHKDLTVLTEQYELTKRELEILQLMMEDNSNDDISSILVISKNTIKKHVINIYRKMDVGSRLELFKLVRGLFQKKDIE